MTGPVTIAPDVTPAEPLDPHRPGPGTARGAATVIAAMLLTGAAGLPLLRVFGPGGLRLLVLSVPVAGLVTTAVRLSGGRGAGPRSPLLGVAAFAAGLVAGTLPGWLLAAPDPFGSAAPGPRLHQAVTDGWQLLLSVPVPVPETRSFTDLPILVMAALSAIVILIALSRHPGIAILPATVAFGGLLVLGIHGPVAGTTLAGAYALAVLIFLASTAPSLAGRAIVSAAVSGALVVAVAMLVTGTVRPGQPYDPRSAVRLPVSVRVQDDPLALLSARLQTPEIPVLTAQLSGGLLSHPRNWVVLAYDSYAGTGWQTSGSAKPADVGTPVPGAIGTGSARVTEAEPADLLPHPSYVLATSPEDLGYDPAAELLASPRAVLRYSVSVSVTEPTLAELDSAAVPVGAPATFLQTPSCVPSALKELAGEVRQEASLPADQAVRLQQVLKSAPFQYDQSAPPGEGCGSINGMLASRKGTSAQFATAFALTARLMGLPARVVAGYLPGRLTGRTDTVTDADAYAWPQVLLTGVGWVDFDPTPNGISSSHLPAREKQPALHKVQINQPPTKSSVPPRIAAPTSRHSAGVAPVIWILGALAALLVLLAAWVAAVRLRAQRRRRCRRRAVSPAARVLGAWDEFLIPLDQAGAEVHGLSAPSVARTAAGLIPAEASSVGHLAMLAERALYDQVGDDDDILAWQLSDRARVLAAAAAGRRAKLRRTFVSSRSRR